MKQLVKVLKQADVRGKKQFLIECQGFVESPLDTAKLYELDIKEYKGKRTLNQNSYFWVFVKEIADKENGGYSTTQMREDLYCNLLVMAGAKFDFVLATEETVKELKKRFRAVKKVAETKVEGIPFIQYQVFFGSSTFNTKEMSHLIDVTLDYANEISIATDYWREVLK